MSPVATHNAPVSLAGPLAETFLFRHMTAREELGRLFRFEVDLLCENPDIKLDELLRNDLTVRLELPDGEHRHFHGIVSRFSHVGSSRRYAVYRATLRPWLWLLTRTADCRIFQNRSVPEIVMQVLREHGFLDFEDRLSGQYRKWEYCTQYRETTFDFISRLLEHEGIYYYFRHHSDRHVLVLADNEIAHDPVPGYETVPFHDGDSDEHEQGATTWHVSTEFEPGTCALTDYDFRRPRTNLEVRAASMDHPAANEFVVFDYPGDYTEREDGEAYARVRLEELEAKQERATCRSTARGLFAGCHFELVNHPRQDQNREYLVVAADHDVWSDLHETGGGGSGHEVYASELTLMSSHKNFRPSRVTPKPVLAGPQTAVVVGPPTVKRIYADPDGYGRVKVRFHWDHRNSDGDGSVIADAQRSCWIRVAQRSAGKGWGAFQLPHVGNEVIVEFLEGDPDRPIITGCVYNFSNKPPAGRIKAKVAETVGTDK